jgi:Nucleotidyltransferase domain
LTPVVSTRAGQVAFRSHHRRNPAPHAGEPSADEQSRVPPLDEAALDRLRDALDREGVVAAMLIGSQARGNPGPLSDVDIAVWHDPDHTAPLRAELGRGVRRRMREGRFGRR